MAQPIQVLTIPKYITKIQTSKKRRRKYYRKQKSKNKDEKIWKPRPLPPTYQDKIDEGVWKMDDKDKYVLDENGEKVLANPQTAGTPNYEPLSGNRFFSGYGNHHVRRTLTKGLKDFYRPFVKKLSPIESKHYPLKIEWDFYTKIKEPNWDMDNMSFYWKYLQDTLVEEGIIPEDNIKFITFPPSGKFIPVENWDDRKFVVRFYPDTRKEITKLWKERQFNGNNN